MSKENVSTKRTELARWLKQGLINLGPTFIKIGQQFSTRVDVLSPEFIKELEELQDNVRLQAGLGRVAGFAIYAAGHLTAAHRCSQMCCHQLLVCLAERRHRESVYIPSCAGCRCRRSARRRCERRSSGSLASPWKKSLKRSPSALSPLHRLARCAAAYCLLSNVWIRVIQQMIRC